MNPALITIGIEIQLEKNANERLFDSIHDELIATLVRLIPNQAAIKSWKRFNQQMKDKARTVESDLLNEFTKGMDTFLQGHSLPQSLDEVDISFSPNKIKVTYGDFGKEETCFFKFTYKSEPITLIMNLGNGKLLCAKGDQIQAISQNKEVDTFVLTLFDEITINSYKI